MTRYRDDLNQVFSQNAYTLQNIVYAMHCARKLIEVNNFATTYPTLNLYCNWCLHTSISQSNVAYRILLEINQAIANEIQPGATWINDAIIEGTKLHVLSEEIVAFGSTLNIPNAAKFSHLPDWKIFAFMLIKHLYDTPIELPGNIRPGSFAQTIRDSILALPTHPFVPVYQFRFKQMLTGDVGWSLEKDGVEFHGPIAIINSQMIQDRINGIT